MKCLVSVFWICSINISHAQIPIDVMESTLRIAGLGEETFYFGFAEGDKLLFNFKEVNRRELKEVEISELPRASRFMVYKSTGVENKTIDVTRTGVYKFRFANSALKSRICHFRIQRIPASGSTKDFNTVVYWRTVYDTAYTQLRECYLMTSDTIITNFTDQISKVSSQTALNGNSNRTVVSFDLPPGTTSWSYYIGVGSEGRKTFEQSCNEFVHTAAKSVSNIPGYGTMAALAIHGLNTFSKVQGRDNVKYWFIPDWDNVLLFQAGQSFHYFKAGDVINEASQMKEPLQGKVHLGLLNDNLVGPIEVIVVVTAVQVRQDWGWRTKRLASYTKREEPYLK